MSEKKVQFVELEGAESMARDAEKLERFKASKREAAKRFKENRAREKAERKETATAVIDDLKAQGLWDKLSEEHRGLLLSFVNQKSSGGTNSLFNQLFGAAPNVGDSFTLNEAFQKTLKGKANIDFYVKKWAEKGIKVSYQQDKDNILNSRYVIDAIEPTAADMD